MCGDLAPVLDDAGHVPDAHHAHYPTRLVPWNDKSNFFVLVQTKYFKLTIGINLNREDSPFAVIFSSLSSILVLEVVSGSKDH